MGLKQENLLSAARRYGDAVLALETEIRSWEPGLPTPALNPHAIQALTSAARAYASAMRFKDRSVVKQNLTTHKE